MRKISIVAATCGAGFIGSVIEPRKCINETDITVANADALICAGKLWERVASPLTFRPLYPRGYAPEYLKRFAGQDLTEGCY